MEKPTKEEITKQLTDILTQVAKTQNIVKYKINLNTEYNYGDGFVGQFYDGKLINEETGEIINVAIKKAPTWEFDYNSIFRNEDLFYRTSYPVIEKLQSEAGVLKPFDNVPKYFCGDLELKKEYIAMENLKHQGYVMFDKIKYFDKEHLEMLFKIYGKFHAISYVLRKKDFEKFQSIKKDFVDIIAMLIQYLEKPMVSAITAAVNSLDPEKDKIIYDEIKDLGDHIGETYRKATSYNGEHRCLLHGDCWSNNMLFKYSESGKILDIKLLDFQLCRDSTPIYDLSYFFYSGASKQDFDNLDNYLQIYHKSFFEFAKELGATADDILTFEELKNEWKENALFGVIMGIYLWQVKLVPKEDFRNAIDDKNDDQKNATMEEKMKQWESVQSTVYGNEKYKERTSAILRHAFEYGVINKDKIVRKAE